MPNKHSHAFVLSYYEAHGLTKFDGPRVPRPQSEYQSQSHSLSVRPPSPSPRRLRLYSPSPPPHPSIKPDAPPQHHRTVTNATVVTEIYALECQSTSKDTTQRDRRLSRTSNKCGCADQNTSPKPARSCGTRCQAEREEGNPLKDVSHRIRVSADDPPHVELEGRDGRGLHSVRPLSKFQRTRSNETVIFWPETSSTQPATADRRSLMDAPGPSFLQGPPSPPWTPVNRRSFSFDPLLDFVPPLPTGRNVEPHSAASPERSSRHDSPISSSTLLSTEPSTVSQPSSYTTRPKTASSAIPKCSSRSLSISARTSSLQASDFSLFDSSKSQASSSSSKIGKHIEEENPAQEIEFEPEPLFFTELESLPKFCAEFGEPDLPSELPLDLDYNILPWGDSNHGNTVPFALRHPFSPSIPTRESSFDSVAPPPIRLSRLNGQIPDQSDPKGPMPNRSRPAPSRAAPKSRPLKARKLARKSISSIFRSQNPISVPYQSTISRAQPIHVSVLRAPAPSIPNLFPNYKGAWPPENTLEKAADFSKVSSMNANVAGGTGRTAMSGVSNTGSAKTSIAFNPAPTPPSAVAPPTSIFRQNGPAPRSLIQLPSKILSDGPVPLAQVPPPPCLRSVDPPVASSRRHGSAVGASTERHRSWFNTDTLDRTFSMRDGRNSRRRGGQQDL